MPPQVETHTIFKLMEEASSGTTCQEEQPGNTDNTFILPRFCLIDFRYRLLV